MDGKKLPLGKLPPELLGKIIAAAPVEDPRVLVGPGIGYDCAVVDIGENLLVLKSDPITFATDEIGWYAVQINANDIVTTGAVPRWFMATMLLPENLTDENMVEEISRQLFQACKKLGISMIGGHTEITYGLDRPILSGLMIGEVAHKDLITPKGAAPGDHILLTKGIPIEATAILAREFPQRLEAFLTPEEVREAANYLHEPGISIYKDALTARQAGQVTAMHDPTEGGLAAALWEMSQACACRFRIDPEAIHIPEISDRICKAFGLNPLATIASGALLLTARAADVNNILKALKDEGIQAMDIGQVLEGPYGVEIYTPAGYKLLERPQRDDITRVYE